jgi:hypothetical protein
VRFHLLGGDLDGTLSLLKQLAVPNSDQMKYTVPDQALEAVRNLHELVENSIMIGNVNQGINAGRPGSSTSGSRAPGNIQKWGDNSSKILRYAIVVSLLSVFRSRSEFDFILPVSVD